MPDFLPKTLVGIVGAIFLFGFAVFVHELGHFLVAKFFGVGVKKFAIGFGPKIWAFVRGGTEYSLRWIPVGGFVSLKGMIEGLDDEAEEKGAKDEKAPSSDEKKPEKKEGGAGITEDLDALRNRHPLARIAVFAAGVTCNFLTAVVLVGIISWRGEPVPAPLPNEIWNVPSDSRLYQLGWRGGDRIVDVAGTPTTTWKDVGAALSARLKEDKPATLTLTAVRQGERKSLPLPTNVPEKDLAHLSPPIPAIVGVAMPQSGAATARLYKNNYTRGETIRPIPTWVDMPKMPLRQDDVIVEIEDVPIHNWQEMDREIRKRPNQAILLTIEREMGGQKRLMRLATVLETAADDPPAGRLGIMRGESFSGERTREPFLTAFGKAPYRTAVYSVLLVRMTIEIIHELGCKETKRNLGGPLKIGQMAYQSAKKGLDQYLSLFVQISLILAIMNLLPIPVLDGGHILITIVETIIRRPIPERVLVPILTTFMLLLITAMGWLFLNDIINW